MIKAIIIGMVAREAFQQMGEVNERRQIFHQAREYADGFGKPLLVVGAPKFGINHPFGDVTIDLSPSMARFGNAEVADVREIPYPDRYFGAAFCSHVLEHLPTITDAFQALDEMERVADKVFTVSPHKTSLMAWINPGHHLWVTPSGDGYVIEQRNNLKPREKSYVITLQVA